MSKALDIGCGRAPKNPFNALEVYGIDIRDDVDLKIKRADLVIDPIPYDDESFDFVSAFDFLEHIPRILYRPHRTHPFINLMNEIYRVLKPGVNSGRFLSFTPAFPQSAAWRDPTHVNIITEETFPLYFDDKNRWATQYGFNGAFKILRQEWKGPHLITIMEKIPIDLIKTNNL